MIEQKVRWLAPALFLAAAAAFPQSKCPPLPEGTPCGHYHYHVAVWNIESRTFSDIAATLRFVSMAACDKARQEAMGENTALVGFIRTSIDSSMSGDRFGDCHCDLTDDPSSVAFLDSRARTNQLRSQQDAAWSLRERLLSRDLPGIGDRVKNMFGPPPRLDRFFRETMPGPVPSSTAPRAPAALLESSVGSHEAMPAIAENISLVAVPVTPAPPAAQPQAPPAATTPPPTPPAMPPSGATAPPVPPPHTSNMQDGKNR
jgi:hypothetical protein